VELPKEFWGTNCFLYMCGVSWGWEVFIIGFNGLSKIRKIEHGQLNFRKKDWRDLTPKDLLSLDVLC